MKVTKEQIKALKPCSSGWKWYCEKERTEDLKELLLEVNENSPLNARWLFTKLMNKKQCVEIAIFSARQVLHIFENSYPEDKRPRNAIEAAENWVKDPSDKNRDAAAAAAYAAATAAAAAYATAAAAAAYAAAADAAAAAAAYAAAARKELQEKIIEEAVKILERPE